MRKILALAVFLVILTFQSCIDNPGKGKGPKVPEFEVPTAPSQPTALVYEVNGTIKITNGYGEIFVRLDEALEVGDIMLGFIYWDDDFGSNQRIWRLLPETVYLNEGILTYKFENTAIDYNFIIETTFNANNLNPIWYTDLTFRAVIIKAKYAENSRIDYTDYDAVMELIGASEAEVLRINR